jgi:hypothetical protein
VATPRPEESALALLASLDPCPEWGWLRVYRAEPTAAFSRRDTLAPGYRLAAAAAASTPVESRRLPGPRSG